MGIFDALDISGSALSAERLRMDVTSENLANAQTTRGANGRPYQRKEVVLQEVGGAGSSFGATLAGVMGGSGSSTPGGVDGAGTGQAQSQGPLVSDPGSPAAKAEGYVRMPKFEPVSE